MEGRLALLYLAAAALMRVADMLGPVVQCGPCDSGALERCRPLPENCAEKVREPGCGCCMTCALAQGDPCGVYTRRCGAGLTCQLKAGEAKPLQALLEGRGVCSKRNSKKPPLLLPAGGQENPEKSGLTEEPNDTSPGTQQPRVVVRVPQGHPKGEVIRRQQSKKFHNFKVQLIPGYDLAEVHNFSMFFQRELEYGPCRTEIMSMLKTFKTSDTLSPGGVPIPNCDKKGFYKKKQCSPSNGRKRGKCWCVDRFGQALPGIHGRKRDGGHCHDLDIK